MHTGFAQSTLVEFDFDRVLWNHLYFVHHKLLDTLAHKNKHVESNLITDYSVLVTPSKISVLEYYETLGSSHLTFSSVWNLKMLVCTWECGSQALKGYFKIIKYGQNTVQRANVTCTLHYITNCTRWYNFLHFSGYWKPCSSWAWIFCYDTWWAAITWTAFC